jgi:hypothetical protein
MSSTSAPGKHPISNNFKGICSKAPSEIYPISPIPNDAIVFKLFYLMSKDKNLE